MIVATAKRRWLDVLVWSTISFWLVFFLAPYRWCALATLPYIVGLIALTQHWPSRWRRNELTFLLWPIVAISPFMDFIIGHLAHAPSLRKELEADESKGPTR